MIEYNENRKDMQVERMLDDFIEECEREAARLEITVDYYIAEFTWLFYWELHWDLWSQSAHHLSLLLVMILTSLKTDCKIKR